MIQIKKCQSKKHEIGGCGDPRCPEGMSIEAAVNDAVKTRDLNSFLTAREMQGATPVYLARKRGMMNLTLATDDKTANFSFPANRPDVVKHIQGIDKTHLPSFEDVESMENYLNKLYHPYARVDIYDEIDTKTGFELKRLNVSDMRVDADIRSLGIGRHMRATILKFADEHNFVVTGTPTESGDGSMERDTSDAEEFKAHALAHKARLAKFYVDSGYEYNYAFAPSGRTDYWTNEPFPKDYEWEKRLHPEAANFLRNSGFYVRWPNNEIPKNWKAGARKPRKKPVPKTS